MRKMLIKIIQPIHYYQKGFIEEKYNFNWNSMSLNFFYNYKNFMVIS